ncbi:MAG: amidase [Chloroflexota bacterium]|jgi:Asp-tRNA(Asn)/Glu-tRNA(Gln) amidotransferase A subunit family amidase
MYDLTSVKLPRLAGMPLRIMRWLLEQPTTRSLLAPELLRSAGVVAYRQHTETNEPMAEPILHEWSASPALDATAHDTPATPMQRTESADSALWQSSTQLHQAYLAGTTTPRAVVDKIISQRKHPIFMHLNAYIAFDDETLLLEADMATQRYAEGNPIGPFDGIPVSIKDEFGVANYRTGGGTTFLGGSGTRHDATAVARLRAAGALVIGKGQMHEIGLGVVGTNLAYGPARNPYNPAHTAGGSSGGGAAAVASCQAIMALGADGGGSIRVPAAYCGLIGLKPTYGRISSHGGAGVVKSMSHPGPIAAYPIDVNATYLLMAGRDDNDARTHHQPSPISANLDVTHLRGKTIGYMPAWFEHADREIVAACRSMLHYFQSAGAELRELSLPNLEAARVAHTIIITREMLDALVNDLRIHNYKLTNETRLSLALAREFNDTDVRKAQQTRTTLINHLKNLYTKVDFIATPTTGLPAPMIAPTTLPHGLSDLSSTFEIMRFAFVANLSGLPAISIPAGYTKSGLPIGFQLMARPWQEHELIEAAQVAEQWRVTLPPTIHL